MQNLKQKLGALVLVIFLGGVLFILFHPSQEAPVSSLPPASETNEATKIYSLTEISTHNNAQNCWTVVRGNVYDLTSWISKHPGGAQAILSLCGKDGTQAFVDQHGGQGQPEAELKSFLIGRLK